MKYYDFKSLNDIEFEELSKDILNEHTMIDFRTFRSGRDKGIDLLGKVEEGNVVVQVKHYANSTFSDLRSTMKLEIKKMKEENPFRYILFTSMDLSVGQCRELIQIMDGYIHNEMDIFDNKRINSIIMHKDFEWIQEKHYKLWLSDTVIIERILFNAQKNNIEYLIQEIIKNLKLYVYTSTFYKAKEILEIEGLIIITGEPGVGKTVLGNLLILNYIENDYNLKFVSGNNLQELESILSIDSELKEIIFLDDFLGSNYIELIKGNNENRLVSFLRKYLRRKNKRVVLTTRTSIYNKAITSFERLNNTKHNLSKLCLELNSYDRIEKANILYNHCYFNLDNKEYFYEIVRMDRYNTIINHKNYNPRIIEFFTDNNRINEIEVSDYYDFIIENLNNPNEIWKYEYESKITNEERFILEIVMSFNGSIELDILEEAFENRYQYEIDVNKYTRMQNAFKRSLQTLTSSFLKTNVINIRSGVIIVSFINPSVFDFIINYYDSNYSELKRLIYGIRYIDQLKLLDIFLDSKTQMKIITTNNLIRNDIADLFKEKFDVICELKTSKILFLSKLISDKFQDDVELIQIEREVVNQKIKNIDTVNLNDFEAFKLIIDSKTEERPAKIKILENLEDIVKVVIEDAASFDECIDIIKYIIKYKSYLIREFFKDIEVKEIISEIIECEVEDYYDEIIGDNFHYEDYIYQDTMDSFDFNTSTLNKDIDDEIENIIDTYYSSFYKSMESCDYKLEKEIIEILDLVEFKDYINEEKIISHFNNYMNTDYYEDMFDRDIRDNEYIEDNENVVITDMFEGMCHRD